MIIRTNPETLTVQIVFKSREEAKLFRDLISASADDTHKLNRLRDSSYDEGLFSAVSYITYPDQVIRDFQL